MIDNDFQKQVNALAQQQLALVTRLNQLTSDPQRRAAPNRATQEDLIAALDEFCRRFRRYKNYAVARGRWLFSLLASQSAQHLLESATAEGLPAATGIAESVVQESIRGGKELSKTDRQFVGAVVRFRMEANGYGRTGRRGRIPYQPFTSGQVYQQIGV